MRPQNRSFVIEYKSGRRRTSAQKKTIWADVNMLAAMQDVEADAPHLFAVTEGSGEAPANDSSHFETVEGSQVAIIDESQTKEDDLPSQADSDATVEPPEFENCPLISAKQKAPVSKSAYIQPRKERRSNRPGRLHASPPAMHFDELMALEAENARLRGYLIARLRLENARLLKMLRRFG